MVNDPAATAVVVAARATPTHAGDVHLLRGDLEVLHRDLLARGPYAAVVDESGSSKASARWQLLAFHVPPGGSFVTRLPSAGRAAPARRKLLDLVAEVSAALARGASPPDIVRGGHGTRHEQDVEALAASFVSLQVEGEWVVAERSGVTTIATVPEQHFDDLLSVRPALGRVVATVAAEADAPALRLREHHGIVLAPRQVVYEPSSPAVVLPASFRFPEQNRPWVRSLVNWSRRSVLAPVHDEPVVLPGTWFHLDNVMRGHFGHALTEQLSLAWAWERARDRHPDLRAVAFERPGVEVGAWEHELFSAAGIDDYVVLPAAVRVESLVTATPAYSIGAYVHPEIHATWASTGESLATRAAPGPRPERLFLSRQPDKRASTDAAAIEALATEHGFVVTRPETLPLSTQVAMVRSARVVAGYAGSAMFHLALTAGLGTDAHPGTEALVISSDTYPAHNEQQICASLGIPLTLVRGISHTREGTFTDLFHSDYTLHTDGWAQLRAAFTRLGSSGG